MHSNRLIVSNRSWRVNRHFRKLNSLLQRNKVISMDTNTVSSAPFHRLLITLDVSMPFLSPSIFWFESLLPGPSIEQRLPSSFSTLRNLSFLESLLDSNVLAPEWYLSCNRLSVPRFSAPRHLPLCDSVASIPNDSILHLISSLLHEIGAFIHRCICTVSSAVSYLQQYFRKPWVRLI